MYGRKVIEITYRDNTIEVVKASKDVVNDGVLHIYYKAGSYVPEEHMGSWPLTGIKKWIWREL